MGRTPFEAAHPLPQLSTRGAGNAQRGKRAMIYVRPYRPGDEAAFLPRPDLAADLAKAGWDLGRDGPPGPTWTLARLGDGRPGSPRELDQVLGVGGGVPGAAAGSFQVWTVMAPIRRHDWGLALLCAAYVIAWLQKEHGARRLTVLVRCGFREAERTMERLGFTRSAEDSRFPGYRVMAKG